MIEVELRAVPPVPGGRPEHARITSLPNGASTDAAERAVGRHCPVRDARTRPRRRIARRRFAVAGLRSSEVVGRDRARAAYRIEAGESEQRVLLRARIVDPDTVDLHRGQIGNVLAADDHIGPLAVSDQPQLAQVVLVLTVEARLHMRGDGRRRERRISRKSRRHGAGRIDGANPCVEPRVPPAAAMWRKSV